MLIFYPNRLLTKETLGVAAPSKARIVNMLSPVPPFLYQILPFIVIFRFVVFHFFFR